MSKAKRPPNARRANEKNNIALEPADGEPDYCDDRALDGLPELAEELPTALVKIHAVFTVQHVVAEVRYQFEMGNLTRGDRALLAQLGKEIAHELEREE